MLRNEQLVANVDSCTAENRLRGVCCMIRARELCLMLVFCPCSKSGTPQAWRARLRDNSCLIKISSEKICIFGPKFMFIQEIHKIWRMISWMSSSFGYLHKCRLFCRSWLTLSKYRCVAWNGFVQRCLSQILPRKNINFLHCRTTCTAVSAFQRFDAYAATSH